MTSLLAPGMQRWFNDDALGTFEMHEWRPAPGSRLFGSVERVWHFAGSTAEPRERVFPDVTLEVIVQLDRLYRPVLSGSAGDPFPQTCVEGLRANAATIEAPAGGCRVLGLRFTPPAACAVLREPLAALTGPTVDLTAVIGRSAAELAERCATSGGAERCIAVAARWVEDRLARRGPDAVATWCARTIVASGGRVRVDALASAAGISAATLTRQFRTHVGVGPKRFARLARFRRTLDALHAGASLTDVAFDGGYFDHAHFDAEFRAHTGLSPTEYLQATRFPQSASLSEAAG